ncbi:excalibur calcium-binding domain-containing protein [Microcoleus sp. N9_A1]
MQRHFTETLSRTRARPHGFDRDKDGIGCER